MTITQQSIRQAKPGTRLYDGKGLYLQIYPSGNKTWRYKYRIKVGERLVEKLLTIGPYPTISLRAARRRHTKAMLACYEGKDPAREKQDHKLMASFDRHFQNEGFQVVQNKDFTGGYNTQHYGQQPNVEAIQLEIRHPIYLAETELDLPRIPQIVDEVKFDQTQKKLRTLFEGVLTGFG